jgi:hypothetical protein
MDKATLVAAMRQTAEAKPTKVDVPKWGVVYVRALTVEEVEEQSNDTESKDKNRVARGACRLICDEKGNRLFDPKSEEDVKLLASQPWSLLHKVIKASEEEVQGNPAGASS